MHRRRTQFRSLSDFKPPRPIATRDGIKANSRQGAFGKNWWATRWISAMERLVDFGRLGRGRSYARRGQVLSIEETREGITAKVQGSRPKPYRVAIRVTHLTGEQWDKVIAALAEQALFTAQLLAGEMPRDIEEAFKVAGVSLFPDKRGDLFTECSCPDYANPCKHVAATHYILGERFDEDPFLIFRLRGRDQDQIMQALRQLRAGQETPDEPFEETPEEVLTPLEESIDHFWSYGESPERFTAAIRKPAFELPLLKRLGEPAFIPEPGLQAFLTPAYQAISQAALAFAFAAGGDDAGGDDASVDDTGVDDANGDGAEVQPELKPDSRRS